MKILGGKFQHHSFSMPECDVYTTHNATQCHHVIINFGFIPINIQAASSLNIFKIISLSCFSLTCESAGILM